MGCRYGCRFAQAFRDCLRALDAVQKPRACIGYPTAGVAFTAWVPAKAAVPGLEDVAKASPEALVAGLSGLYKTAALVIAMSSILAITALYPDRRRGRP